MFGKRPRALTGVIQCGNFDRPESSTRWQHRTKYSNRDCAASCLVVAHCSRLRSRSTHLNRGRLTRLRTKPFIPPSVKYEFLFFCLLFLFKLYVKTHLHNAGSYKLLHLTICHVIWEPSAESAVHCSSKGSAVCVCVCVRITTKNKQTSTWRRAMKSVINLKVYGAAIRPADPLQLRPIAHILSRYLSVIVKLVLDSTIQHADLSIFC